MANEITSTFSVTATKGNVSVTRSLTKKIDMAGTVYAGQVVSVPTTAAGTAVSIGTVGTAGVSTFRNLDGTNYIEIGIQVGGTFYPLVQLLPGEGYPFRLAIGAPFARSNTAACLLEYTILEA